MRPSSETGGRALPDLVLAHGWGMHPGCWGGYGDALESAFRVHAPALPGHGGAPPEPGWSPYALAERWSGRWPRAVWVGWSLGAQVALTAAMRWPDRVRGLVLIGATPRFVAGQDWPHAVASSTFDDFLAGCRDAPEATLKRFAALQVQGSEHPRPVLLELRRRLQTRRAPDRAALEDGLRVLADTDLREGLAEVSCPTLWVSGAADTLAPPAAAEWSSRKQPRARVSCLTGAGHAPFISHERSLSDLTLQWFLDDTP